MKTDPRYVALRRAVDEAERFIARALVALEDETPWAWQSARRATARRASMDLTRALAEWRQAR